MVNNKTKELIIALIIKSINPNKLTDLISGKGNRLIILLYGYNLRYT